MAAKQNVKRRIVDAAWELFYEKGYDDTTVDDIIRLSETSKGSFYYYFSSKDSLLDTLSTILDENYAKLEDELDPEMNSFDKLMYLNYRSHSFMEQKIDVALLSSLYSTQLIAKGELCSPYRHAKAGTDGVSNRFQIPYCRKDGTHATKCLDCR